MDTFVDTSALIALLDGQDPRNPAVVAALASMERDRLITHGYVVAESIAVARRRLGPEAAVALIDQILPTVETLAVSGEQHRDALRRHRSSLPSATSFVDQVSFVVIEALGVKRVFALDTDFEAIGVDLIPGR